MRTRSFVIAVLASLVATTLSVAQSTTTDSTLSLDILVAPASPGFVLLGKPPAAVERPGNVTDLTVSIMKATNDLSVIPENFALELAPYWLLAGASLTYEEYAREGSLWSNFIQTFTLSIATATEPGSTTTSRTSFAGLGARFSLLRGTIDAEFSGYSKRLDSLDTALGKLNDAMESAWTQLIMEDKRIKALEKMFNEADPSVKPLLAPVIQGQIAAREAEIKADVEKKIRSEHAEALDKIKGIISRIKIRRVGWKLDVAGGGLAGFPDAVAEKGTIDRYGLWFTGGYEGSSLSMLGVARYLVNKNDDKETSLDLGERLIFERIKQLALSAEIVYRKYPKRDKDQERWRLAAVVDYELARNTIATITLGKDYNSNLPNSLLASVNISFGLGSDRPVR